MLHLDVDREASSPGSDEELDTHALAIISFVYNRIIAGAAPALRKHTGLSVTEARIVFHIGATGATSANRLARTLGLDKAAISRSVSRLVDLELIASERDPHHAARNILTLTATGETNHRAIAHFTYGREKHLLSVLEDDEHQRFLESLKKVLANVDSTNRMVELGHFWDVEEPAA